MTDALARILNIWHLWHVENKCQFHQLLSSMMQTSSNPTRNSVQRSQYQSQHFSNFANHGFGSVRVLHYFLYVSSSSVRFCQIVGSSLVRSVRVRFDSHIYFIIKTTSANIAATIRTWLQKVLDPMRQDWCLQIYFCLMWSKTDLFGLALWTTYANLHQNSYHWLNPPLIETHILQHARICLSNKMTQELQSTE